MTHPLVLDDRPIIHRASIGVYLGCSGAASVQATPRAKREISGEAKALLSIFETDHRILWFLFA